MRIVAENTMPIYASRCSLGFTIASFLGAPVASMTALLFKWQAVFVVCGVTLLLLGGLSFTIFQIFEQKGIIRYKAVQRMGAKTLNIKLLLERSVIKFALIAMIT